jgi:DNA-binding SARP family transcriptional activator/tetratricopeptide (TPR) repeat protein
MTASNPFMRMDATGREKMVVRGLGAAEVTVGGLVLAPDADILFSLAVVLGIRSGERLARAELRQLIWPGIPDDSSRHSLRQALYKLHKAGLASEDSAEEIRVAPEDIDCDVADVLKHDWPYRAEPQEIERAAVLLPGYAPDEGSALAEWLETVRARVSAQYRRATLHRIGSARREGRWREVEHWALMCLQADPLNEEATLARAEAAAMVGAKFEALEVLDAYLRELGSHAKVIGLPVRMLKRRISELSEPRTRRVTAASVPFVGRHDLLARAQDTLADARAGSASAIWFVGPAGIGKSRLLREVERAAKMAGWTIVRGGARPSSADRPLALLTDLLPELLEAPGALGAAPTALSLMRQMGTAHSDEESLPPEEARVRQHAVYNSWVELMEAVLCETPLVLLLDDLHWSDPPSLVMLSRFLETHPSARLAILCSTRRVPDRTDVAAVRLLGAPDARVMPLSENEIRDFTAGAGVADDGSFEEVTRRLGRASGGNPLFLSHLLHHHQTRHELFETPRDLSTLIEGQLRVLSRQALRLLQACALLGKHSTLPRLERSLGLSAPQMLPAFEELDEMLALPIDTNAPLAPHDVWTECVRRGMTTGVFRSLAVSVARVLEIDAAGDGGIELYWDAARLFQESGEKQLAYATMMTCAEYLLRTGATSAASRAYDAASDLATTPEAAIAALLRLMGSLQAMAEWPAVLKTAERTRSIGGHLLSSEQSATIRMLVLEAGHFTNHETSDLSRFCEAAQDDTLATHHRLYAAYLGMTAADNCHDSATLRELHSVAAHLPAQTGDELIRLKIAIVYQAVLGDLDQSTRLAGTLVESSRRQSNRSLLIANLRIASYAYRRNGEYEHARALITESLELAEQGGFAYAQFRAHDLLAGMALEYQRAEEAVRHLRSAEELFDDRLGRFNRISLAISWLFWAIDTGQWTRARQILGSIESVEPASRSRHHLLPIAGHLRVALHERNEADARIALEHLLGHGPELFRHANVDHIAEAVCAGIEQLSGAEAAREFATQFVRHWRRDRSPCPAAILRLVT